MDYTCWLVVSNMKFFIFHFIKKDVILPIDFHSIIFQDGYCTTNQLGIFDAL